MRAVSAAAAAATAAAASEWERERLAAALVVGAKEIYEGFLCVSVCV